MNREKNLIIQFYIPVSYILIILYACIVVISCQMRQKILILRHKLLKRKERKEKNRNLKMEITSNGEIKFQLIFNVWRRIHKF